MMPIFIPGAEFQRLQPLIFLESMVYVPGESGPVNLISPSGRLVPMRRFCPISLIADHSRRANWRRLNESVGFTPGREIQTARQAVDLFVQIMLPSFRAYTERQPAGADIFPDETKMSSRLPVPDFPVPSILMLGRFWQLESRESDIGFRVQAGDRRLVLSGEYTSAWQVSRVWQEQSVRVLEGDNTRFTEATDDQTKTRLLELERRGFLAAGDLILFHSEKWWLAHVIPSHYNMPLGQRCNRSLAVAAPLIDPRKIPGDTELRILFVQGSKWHFLELHRQVCLGHRPPEMSMPTIAPTARLAAFLRFAAARLAANGKFNENDQGGELCPC